MIAFLAALALTVQSPPLEEPIKRLERLAHLAEQGGISEPVTTCLATRIEAYPVPTEHRTERAHFSAAVHASMQACGLEEARSRMAAAVRADDATLTDEEVAKDVSLYAGLLTAGAASRLWPMYDIQPEPPQPGLTVAIPPVSIPARPPSSAATE